MFGVHIHFVVLYLNTFHSGLFLAETDFVTLGVARLDCAAVYRIYSTGTPPERGMLEEYFSDCVVAEEVGPSS